MLDLGGVKPHTVMENAHDYIIALRASDDGVRRARVLQESIDAFDGQLPFAHFDFHVPADLKSGVAQPAAAKRQELDFQSCRLQELVADFQLSWFRAVVFHCGLLMRVH